MARLSARSTETIRHSHRCSVCGAALRLEEWRRDEAGGEYGGLAPEQYVELFWEEA